MRHIKIFEDFTVTLPIGSLSYPDFFKDEIFDYYNLLGTLDVYDFPHTDDLDYWEKVNKIEKYRKKLRKKKKKDILRYINDFIRSPENEKFCNGLFCEFGFEDSNDEVLDFEFVFTGGGTYWKVHKLKTLKLKKNSGTYELNQKDFEDLVKYINFSADTKKYNL